MENHIKNTRGNYGAGAIDVSIGADKYRESVARYLGADDYVGVENQLIEFYDNAIDETIAYQRILLEQLKQQGIEESLKPRTVELTIHTDWSVTLLDHGRGIPIGVHPVQKDTRACYLIYENDSAGAKGRHNKSNSAYGAGTTGMHGAGACVSTACTDRMTVTVGTTGEYDENGNQLEAPGVYIFGYEKGNRVMNLNRIGDLEPELDPTLARLGYMNTFTKIEYKYAEDVFEKVYGGDKTATPYQKDKILERIKFGLMSMYEYGDIIQVQFKFLDDETMLLTPSNCSVNDYLEITDVNDAVCFDIRSYLAKVDKNYYEGRIFMNFKPNQFTYNSKTVVNRLPLNSGAFNRLFQECLVSAYSRIIYNKLPEEANNYVSLTNIDYEAEKLVDKQKVIMFLTMSDPQFAGQTKKDLSSSGFSDEFQQRVDELLDTYMTPYFEKYIDTSVKALIELANQRKRDAEKTKIKVDEEVLKKELETQKTIDEIRSAVKTPAGRIKILKEAEENQGERDRYFIQRRIDDPEDCYLVIAEGPSAINGLGKYKDLPLYTLGLTGKPKNVDKEASLDFKQIEVLVTLLLCNFKGIYLITDADPDGEHIRVLVLAIILKFAPDYLNNQKMYIVNSPYSRLRNNTGNTLTLNRDNVSITVNMGEDVYTIDAQESMDWVKQGMTLLRKYNGLADSLTDENNITMKSLLTDPRYISRVLPPTDEDKLYLTDVLSDNSRLKKEYSNAMCSRELIFMKNISHRVKDLKIGELETADTTYTDYIPVVLDWKKYGIISDGICW